MPTFFSILLSIVVSAQIDSATIMLGDQTDLHLQATCAADEHVQFPVYGETLMPDIEIVDRTIVDTTTLADGRRQLNQYLTITSFRDSLFYISPIPFTVDGDTFLSEPLTLNVVQPFELDSADNAITDIKDVWRAPIWWWGIIRWILLALLIVALAIGSWYLNRFIGQYTKRYTPQVAPEPKRPAEEVALEKLNRIHEEKIWQAGQVKEYHTQLTDVVREYIAARFDVRSAEKTSDETLRAVRPLLNERKELFAELQKMLQLADLVKFAKWTATPDENEQSLHSAYHFVRETTPHEEEKTEDVKS